MDNKKSVKLGDGMADKVKDNINENILETLTMLSNIAFNYLKEKVKDIPQEIEIILSSAEAQKEILTLWSNQLCERGLIPKGYNGLPYELLIANFRQEGYLDGLYAGYKLQRILYQHEVETLEASKRESQERIRNHESFITDMVRYASSEENPDKVLNQLVQYIGERLHSERAYIFEENDHGTFDNTYEWCKEGVSREKDNLQNVPYEGIVEVWFQQYQKSKNIIIYDIEEYKKTSEAIYDLLKPQGVNTLVTGPIKIEGKMIGFYGVDNPPVEILHDISDLIEMMEFMISFMIRLRKNANALEHSALYDQLTNCKNRKALDWVYTSKIMQCESLAVVMCDLNGLKEINDKQGHDAGDRFICKSAEILKSIFGNDQIYRIGGDEFIAVLPNISFLKFNEQLESARDQLGTTAAIGTVYKDILDTDFEAILKIADAEMYERKRDYYISTGKERRKHNL